MACFGDNALADVELFFEDKPFLDDQDLFEDRNNRYIPFDPNLGNVIYFPIKLDAPDFDF